MVEAEDGEDFVVIEGGQEDREEQRFEKNKIDRNLFLNMKEQDEDVNVASYSSGFHIKQVTERPFISAKLFKNYAVFYERASCNVYIYLSTYLIISIYLSIYLCL